MASPGSLLKSAVQRGTEFERRSLLVLQKHLSMSLNRIGGKSDGGIDLQGWWWLPSFALTRKEFDDGLRRRVRVLAQCKAIQKKMGPNFVREMEGVLFQYSNETAASASQLIDTMIPTVAVLISQSPFTTSTILRAMSSSHSPIGSAIWNRALCGDDGLLRGQIEARWERNPNGSGRPGLWWKGEPLRSWVPE
ncbi:uncharacterized protein EI90DRAFT_3281117 [Cantharellus anzutake]|uniref:uncharacterized protein n=1 Tax=Cantharellus anzutake TaxID=1750568 RepID=UPI001905BF56|nr:uncharacterized protein EI90DRAFT_3281117 [Cantharellus anzutake]KAF8329436.1 hypothetical protein EI90DRAFT_3281117 [Cantharellus anzutake]